MRYLSLGAHLPYRMRKILFGDRETFGIAVQEDDLDWQEWQETILQFYNVTQKQSVGESVNNAGYDVLSWVDLSGQRVLEIGPGNVSHLNKWQGNPQQYVMVDISPTMLLESREKLDNHHVNYESILVSRNNIGRLPFKDETFDVILSFYALEHLYPFSQHLEDLLRVLKPHGKLIGSIPAEGGMGWGLGRYLTSRRWLLKNTTINPDKIICWEHPNFAQFILKELDVHPQLTRRRISMWPLGGFLIDVNLVVKFLYEKIP